MEEGPNNKNRITKTEWLSWRITKKLGQSKEIDGYSKKSHKEAIQQEKKKSTRIEGWGQYMARSQKYPFKVTLKEAGLKKIQTF